jgi:hypothetical protein
LSFERSDNDQALPTLRNTEIGCQDRLLCEAIAESIKRLEQELEPLAIVIRVRECEDVLEQEHPRPRLVEDANVVLQQAGLRVKPSAFLLDPVAGLREGRTGRAADKQLWLAPPEPGSAKQLVRVDPAYVAFKNRGRGKVHPKRLTCVRVVFDGGPDRETGLFDAEIKTSGAGEKVDCTPVRLRAQ